MQKKTETSALRHELSKVRRQTRKARAEKDAIDNAFMSVLRDLRFNTPVTTLPGSGAADTAGVGPVSSLDISRLQAPLEKMQEARHRCQAWELSLEALEDDFETAHEELDYLERLLINDLRPGAQRAYEKPGIKDKDDHMPEPLLGLQEEPVKNHHPLYMRFMSTLRDQSLAEEEYHDSLQRKALIEDDLYRLELVAKYQQGSMGSLRPPDARDLDFLGNFEKEEKKSLDRMEQLRTEAQRLRDRCFEEGLVPRYAGLMDIYTYYPWEFYIDPAPATEMDEAFDVDQVSYMTRARFWILLTQPRHLLEHEPMTAKTALEVADAALKKDPGNLQNQQLRNAAEKEYIIENLIRDAREGDKGNFISRWALQRLRISPSEVELLYSIFEDETGLQIHDVHRWQQEVLYCWPRDAAARLPPEQYKGAISREESSEGSFSDSSLLSSNTESILSSDQTETSGASGARSHMQIGDQSEAEDEDVSGHVEALPLPPENSPGPPEEEHSDQPGAVLTAPPEGLQSLETEVSLDMPLKEPRSPEPDTVHAMPSEQARTLEVDTVFDAPSENSHNFELEVVTATPVEEAPEQSAEPPVSTEQAEQPIVSPERASPSKEEARSPLSQAVIISEASPVPSEETQIPGSEAMLTEPSLEPLVSSEDAHSLEPETGSSPPS